MKPAWIRILAGLLALSQVSCAVNSLTPLEHSMPAARAALAPEFRIFYDTLGDYGDWTLIEPFGYVFRPHARAAQWQPYYDGFWTPTDSYGWVWVSSEPFGWATYHYGQWLNDRFQGWVWVPGLDWGPAQVNWQATDTYVGWAPLAPRGDAPASSYVYVPVSQLGSTDLTPYLMRADQVGPAATTAQAIDNEDEVQGVRFNRGPALDWVERKTGPLSRARIEDLVPPSTLNVSGVRPRSRDGARSTPPADSLSVVRRAGERAANQAREISKSEDPPQRLSMVRPFGMRLQRTVPAERPASVPRPKKKGAASPDTTR